MKLYKARMLTYSIIMMKGRMEEEERLWNRHKGSKGRTVCLWWYSSDSVTFFHTYEKLLKQGLRVFAKQQE